MGLPAAATQGFVLACHPGMIVHIAQRLSYPRKRSEFDIMQSINTRGKL